MNSDMSIQGKQIAREVEKIFIDYSISRQRFHDMLMTYAQADQDVWIWGEARRRKQRRTGQHTTEEEKRLSYYALLTAVHDHYLPDEPRIIAPDLLELDESGGMSRYAIAKKTRLDSLLALPAGLESRLADAQLALKYVKADLDAQAVPVGEGKLTDTESTISVLSMTKRYSVPLEALRKRLDRRRRKDSTCFVEVENVGGRTPKYLYYSNKIMDIIDDLRISASKTSDKRPPKNNKKNMS